MICMKRRVFLQITIESFRSFGECKYVPWCVLECDNQFGKTTTRCIDYNKITCLPLKNLVDGDSESRGFVRI